MLDRIANGEDPDQTASKKQSDLGLSCLSRQLVLKILEHFLYSKTCLKQAVKR